MKIQIDKQFLIHEGGTKFYQVLRILTKNEHGGHAVTITNWGKHTGEPGPRRMLIGGDRQIKAGDSYQTTIKAKKGRGYTDRDNLAWGTTNVLDQPDRLEIYLIAELGATEAQEVMKALGFAGLGPADIEATRDPAFSPLTPATPEPISEAIEGWGDF